MFAVRYISKVILYQTWQNIHKQRSTELLSRQKQKSFPTFDYLWFLIWYCVLIWIIHVHFVFVFLMIVSKMMMVIVGMATFTPKTYFISTFLESTTKTLFIERWTAKRDERVNKWFWNSVGCQPFMMSTENLLGSSYLTFNFRLDILFYYVFFFYNFLVGKETTNNTQKITNSIFYAQNGSKILLFHLQ